MSYAFVTIYYVPWMNAVKVLGVVLLQNWVHIQNLVQLKSLITIMDVSFKIFFISGMTIVVIKFILHAIQALYVVCKIK